MPAKKKTAVETEAAATTPKKRATKKAVEPAASATSARKKAPVKLKFAAATHKASAKRTSKAVSVTYGFDVEAHREEIAHEAYFLWLNRSCGPGHEHEDWLRAIEIVKNRRSSTAK